MRLVNRKSNNKHVNNGSDSALGPSKIMIIVLCSLAGFIVIAYGIYCLVEDAFTADQKQIQFEAYDYEKSPVPPPKIFVVQKL